MLNSFKSLSINYKSLGGFVKKYKNIIGALLVLAVFSFVIFRIDTLSNPDINQGRYDSGILELTKIRFDTDAINTINDLNPTNVRVGENIDETRTNPF